VEVRFHKFTYQDSEKLQKDSVLSIATIRTAVLCIGTIVKSVNVSGEAMAQTGILVANLLGLVISAHSGFRTASLHSSPQ
jgi:hypothetical protein